MKETTEENQYRLDVAARERLTKFVDGCAHKWVQDGHVSHHKCTECGETLSVRKEFLPKLRTFGTGNDMDALKIKIVWHKEWLEFNLYALNIFDPRPLPYDGELAYLDWLFTPNRFAWLVSEWLKTKTE